MTMDEELYLVVHLDGSDDETKYVAVFTNRYSAEAEAMKYEGDWEVHSVPFNPPPF